MRFCAPDGHGCTCAHAGAYACTLHECTRTAADSRMLAQRILLDGTSTRILPFERAQISDKSRTSRHSRIGLLGWYIKAPGTSVLSPARSPGNTRLVLQEKRTDV